MDKTLQDPGFRNLLMTGNRGYIGSVLTKLLEERSYRVTGWDAGFYAGCELEFQDAPRHQVTKDIRDALPQDLEGVGAVIHLAALCNDPLGEMDPVLTEEINFKATVLLARLAKEAGVKRFIYSSSQSMYGIAVGKGELDEDLSEKKPLTAYARTKWQAECALKDLSSPDFVVVCLRPSTVFGVSPAFRSDIVFNNLLASAYTTGRIELKSDGAPWRPVVHVRDLSKAFIAALEAPAALVGGESFNVGMPEGNFTVRELAETAQQLVPGSRIVHTKEHTRDSRTYRVSFGKILSVLKDYYQPEWDLETGGKEILAFFGRIGLTEPQFRGETTNRLIRIHYLLEAGKIGRDLRWNCAPQAVP